jgi:hypothetical protein
MIEKVTISRISFFDKDKDGNQLKTKDGKPYTRCLLDTTDGRKISGFRNAVSAEWKVADEVEIEVEKKGEYWNFKTVKKEGGGVNQEQLDRIEKMIIEIHQHTIGVQPPELDPNDPNNF